MKIRINYLSLIVSMGIVLSSIPIVAETNTSLELQILLYLSFTVAWAIYFPVIIAEKIEDKE